MEARVWNSCYRGLLHRSKAFMLSRIFVRKRRSETDAEKEGTFGREAKLPRPDGC